jgi:hypothetical protein
LDRRPVGRLFLFRLVDYGVVARIRRSTPMPSAADAAAAILSRFPGPATLYPSRKK